MKNKKPATGELNRQTSGRVTIRADTAENERKARISISSEEPYERWFGVEILSHAEGAVDLSRLNDIGVVLFNHDRDAVIGKIEKAWVENERLCADIVFDEDEDSEKVYSKVKSGTLKGVSVGYRVDVWEEVLAGKKSTDGKYTGPCYIARKWTPLEASIVSVPADATVGVGRSENDDEPQKPQISRRFEELEKREKQLKNNIERMI